LIEKKYKDFCKLFDIMAYFKTTDLVVIAFMAALVLILNVFTNLIVVITGVPMSSMLSPLLGGIAISLTALIIRKFGAITLFGLIFGILAVPTNILGGPGLHKILVTTISCIVFDVVFLVLKWRLSFRVIVATALGVVTMPLTLVYIGAVMGLPGIDKLMGAIIYITIGGLIVAGIGGFVGFKIYDKIKGKSYIKRLQV
jgi:hypothetical protein